MKISTLLKLRDNPHYRMSPAEQEELRQYEVVQINQKKAERQARRLANTEFKKHTNKVKLHEVELLEEDGTNRHQM
jgi:hypothetical protein